MIYTIYITNKNNVNESLELVLHFFKVHRVKFIIHEDVKTLMLMTKGRVNPNVGFVVLIQGRLCYDIFDICKAYEEMGLRPC